VSAGTGAEEQKILVFEHEGHAFTAHTACRDSADRNQGAFPARMHGGDVWWWFEVAGDQQRYAPFRAEPGESDAAVKAAMVTYYCDLLKRRAEKSYGRFGGGPRRPGSGGQPVPAASDASATPASPGSHVPG
jgi:hypothetical protein